MDIRLNGSKSCYEKEDFFKETFAAVKTALIEKRECEVNLNGIRFFTLLRILRLAFKSNTLVLIRKKENGLFHVYFRIMKGN